MELLNPDIKDYPGDHIDIALDNPELKFSEAKDIARQRAKERCDDPMLLSWYQAKTGESYPNMECGPGDKPAWITYSNKPGKADTGLARFILSQSDRAVKNYEVSVNRVGTGRWSS